MPVKRSVRNMREILFRGKNVEDDRWRTGDLLTNELQILYPEGTFPAILRWYDAETSRFQTSFVAPETVGAYTGAKDANGAKIFEGDIVLLDNGEILLVAWRPEYAGIVCTSTEWNEGCAPDDLELYFEHEVSEAAKHAKVIGNLHDNPELLSKRFAPEEEPTWEEGES